MTNTQYPINAHLTVAYPPEVMETVGSQPFSSMEEVADVAARLAERHAGMVFVADDLAAWLIFILAEKGRKKLTALVLGSKQERALQSAATAAVQRTAEELRPDNAEQAEDLAMVIDQVFGEPVPGEPLADSATVLEALQAGIAAQLAVLDDASLTGTEQSSAQVLGVPGTVVAAKLTSHLLREIVVRGSRGGPLFPLASQLNDDVTHLQGRRIEGVLGQLADEVREALARLDGSHAVAAPTALAQLPPVTVGFTGRDDELAVLAGLLDPATAGGPVLVSAVAGLAGVGKTTLAVAAGHAARERGWFGGGVLFIDLHGYDDQRVEPGQALDTLLRALRVPAEYIPPSAEERAGLYRSVLAQVGEPVLVVADNASSEAQVRPLLPGTTLHKVLVTSRHTLAGLGARLVDVTVLDEETAVELMDGALQAARPGDDRMRTDPEAASRLADVCGGLPLALQITAALLNADPTLSVAELADELAVESARLALLAYDDGSGAAGLSVATAFDLSYRRLDETSARVFRLLPVNPGPDVSTAAAAALAGLTVRKARGVLAGLARAHQIEAAPGAPGRWRMHDLLRLYAQRLSDAHADADGRNQGRDRLLNYYLRTADAASQHLRAVPGMALPEDFTGRASALDWLDAERPSLIAAITTAADTGPDEAAMRLPALLAPYLVDWRLRFDDALVTATISRDYARRLGDLANEATALNTLGIALREMRRFEEAITAHQYEATICRQSGDRHGEGKALGNLGTSLREARRFEEAITAHQAAAAICRQSGDRHGEGKALGNLGNDLEEVQRFDEAITAHEDAAVIFRETGDQRSEGIALFNLSSALQGAGRFEEAIIACQAAATICRDVGDQRGEGMALNNLGGALAALGRYEEAIAAYEQDIAICRKTGDRHGEGFTLDNLGTALQELHRFEDAIAAHQDAAAIYRETGDRHREGMALGNLGVALQGVARFDEAITALQNAVAIFRETDDQDSERIALDDLEAARAAQRA